MRRLPGSPRTQMVVGAVGVIVLLAVGGLVLRPSGAEDSRSAALDRVPDTASGDPVTLLERPWGEGVFVLVAYEEQARTLGLAFAIDRGRGWRVAGWTSEETTLTDVQVGSMLVGSSEGGDGQPAWSAVYGELGDDRIARVEVEWSEGEPTSAEREGDAYFVVRADIVEPTFVRYLDADGEEIAKVPAQPG